MSGWVGVDLDGTLAHFDGTMEIGAPVPAMKARVLRWIAEGREVRIFTARASVPELIPPVKKWLSENGFPELVVTYKKDFGMIELWDDRAVRVRFNTGEVNE